jgi:hypothetical protein
MLIWEYFVAEKKLGEVIEEMMTKLMKRVGVKGRYVGALEREREKETFGLGGSGGGVDGLVQEHLGRLWRYPWDFWASHTSRLRLTGGIWMCGNRILVLISTELL